MALLSGGLAITETVPQPPFAKRIEHRDVRHGETVIDNYYWLRDKKNPEVIQYLEAENAYTAELSKNLKGFEDALYKEMLGHIKQTDLSVPVRDGGYYYYMVVEERESLFDFSSSGLYLRRVPVLYRYKLPV